MHLFCIKLMTLLTLIKCNQSSILPSLITDKNPSHHQHHGSPSAFHDFSSSSSLISSSSSPPPSNLDLLSSSSSSPSSLSFSSSSSSPSLPLSSSSSSSSSPSSTDVEISDIINESALNQNDNNNGDDRFHSLVSQESHNTQSGPSTNYNNYQNLRSSILLPKIYPSSVISDQFSSSNTFPSHSNSNPDEGKSLDYATTLIKEALEGPMMHDSNGDSSDYVESSSSSSPSSSSEFDGTVGRMGSRIFGERKENGPSEIDSGIVGNIEEERKGSTSDEIEPVVASDGDEVNAVQPSEDQLFYEVQKLIQLIREAAAHTDEKGSSPKSRNNRNRLTLQMDYLQNLLDEYRQKQGSLNLRHWVRGVSPPRLSVTSPIAVLRDALMEEIKRKKIQETQAKIAMNEKILKEVG